MELHVEALFRHDAAGRLLSVNEPDHPTAPRLFIGRTPAGNLWRVRHDLPASVARELASIVASEPVTADLEAPLATLPRLRAALEAHAPVERVWQGPAWRVPEGLVPPSGVAVAALTDGGDEALWASTFPWLGAELADRPPCLAVIQNCVAVALCCSARLTATAAEAGVETLADFRGRGYASAAVVSWARAVSETGRTPLYSTSWDNHASRGVARRLGLELFGADTHLT